MKHEFIISEYLEKMKSSENYWISFMEKQNFEFGVMHLKVGKTDIQTPHTSDEVYLILRGNGSLIIDDKPCQIKENTCYFVPKNTQHRFVDFTEDIIAFYVLN
ncbi:MAG: cupin domain-containing protein [Candidatus Heimdallarchaeota archaeon]|nr:cupin domain-containing protein [Candidatus Heimdallarchaeota archaeon]MDH5646964.1 cupin domain-containing protein [Candidatus Heimdallarchaeota archaeon]